MIIDTKINFTIVGCGSCGIVYALPKPFYDEIVKTGKTFYCPNGCARKFSPEKDTEKDYLKRRVAFLEEDVSYLERSRSSYKGQVTKLKRGLK